MVVKIIYETKVQKNAYTASYGVKKIIFQNAVREARL